MAESQEEFAYDQAGIDALSENLSAPRLAPYLAQSNNDPVFAFQRYLWNARLAKSLLFPLQVAEVASRNAIHRTFSAHYGGEIWIKTPPPGLLTPASEDSRQNGLRRLALAGKPDPSPNEIVAALTFDFWSNLFRPEYDPIWTPAFSLQCFPQLLAPYDWHYIQVRARRINWLRNRIAHHEPIWHDPDLAQDYERCLELIRLCSAETRAWVQRHSTFRVVHRSPPLQRPSLPGLNLSALTFETPVILTGDDPILDAIGKLAAARPALGLLHDGTDWKVLTTSDLLAAISSKAGEAEGYVSLGEMKVGEVAIPDRRLLQATPEMTTGDVLGKFFPPNTQKANRPAHILLLDSTGAPIGLIERPTIRYR